jgi:ankyrin repeat protein
MPVAKAILISCSVAACVLVNTALSAPAIAQTAQGEFWTVGEISPEARTLFDAGDAAGLRALLKNKPELAKATNHVRWTLLHFATASYTLKNQVEICAALLESGADVDAKEGELNTPLQFAIHRPRAGQPKSSSEVYLGVLRLLLEKGADVNAKNYLGVTALHAAVLYGAEVSGVELLIEHGAKVNAVADAQGWTPLHGAAGMGRADLVEVLLKHGADRTLKDGRGMTPLQVAEAAKKDDIVKMLQAKH